MQGNPLVRNLPQYRKTVIARCQALTYLDDRPVFKDERRCPALYLPGGIRTHISAPVRANRTRIHLHSTPFGRRYTQAWARAGVYGRPARSAPPADEGQDAGKAAVQPEKGSEEGAGATRSDANKEVVAANKEDDAGENDPDDDIDLDSLPPLTAPPPPSPLFGTFGRTSLPRPIRIGRISPPPSRTHRTHISPPPRTNRTHISPGERCASLPRGEMYVLPVTPCL